MIVTNISTGDAYVVNSCTRDRYNITFGDCLVGMIHGSTLSDSMYKDIDQVPIVQDSDGTRYSMFTSAIDLTHWDKVGKVFQYSVPYDKFIQVMLIERKPLTHR